MTEFESLRVHMKKSFTFAVPIYGCDVRVIVTKNFKRAAKKLSIKHSLADINRNCAVACNLDIDSLYVILIKPKYKDDWDTIAHESLHVTNYILSDRGIKCTMKNDEAAAYLLGFIIKNIQSFKDKA